MNAALVSGIALVVSGLVSGLFMWLIKRSEDSSQRETNSEQIRAGAFKDAKEIYSDALVRAKAEIQELVDKVARFEGQVAKLESELETERGERRHAITTAHREISDLRLKLAEAHATVEQLRRVIASQRRGDLPAGIDLKQPPDLPDNEPDYDDSS